jgi:CheY-like chemotaxis protein
MEEYRTLGNMREINTKIRKILLADDDQDDRMFFQDALQDIDTEATLTTAENGEELMQMLGGHPPKNNPDIIFLDLNMPCKNGYECLAEIKNNDSLKHLPVVIFSTSLQQQSVNTVYDQGASLYIVKPNSFSKLKQVIENVLSLNWADGIIQPSREKFILQA